MVTDNAPRSTKLQNRMAIAEVSCWITASTKLDDLSSGIKDNRSTGSQGMICYQSLVLDQLVAGQL
jgi:hypothetical protein